MLSPSAPGPLAAARISPVDGLTATSAEAGPTPASACSAAICSAMSIVSWSGWPSTGSTRKISRVLPSEPTALTSWPGVPRKVASYLAWRPERPATSPRR